MDNKEIRAVVMRLITENPNKLFELEDFYDAMDSPPKAIEANIQYLQKRDYLICEYWIDGSVAIKDNGRSLSYFIDVEEEEAQGARIPAITISGNSNVIAGSSANIQNSHVGSISVSVIPPEFQEEIEGILEYIRDQTVPRKEKASKMQSFLEKIAVGCSSSVVAAAAAMFLKNLLGIQ